MAEELNPIYYMRDNHTFKLLSGDADTAIVEIEAEFNAGYTCGMLCSKRPGFKNIHAHGNETRFKFFAECKQALQSALTSTEHPASLYTAPAPAVPSDAEIEANIWPALRLNGHPNLTLYDCIASIRAALTAAPTPPAQSAVPEDVAREPMTQRWCWWIGDAETFHIADTESEAHGEARCRIDDDCEPGDTREYSVGRVQHPIDALGVEWLAEHVAETIEENTREWCDDNTGAEDQSITLAAEDRKVLGTMVAAFLREKVSVHWWTADQKTITTHTYVAGSNDADAARAAEKGGA